VYAEENMKLVFVISGPVGVGKSTFCQEFSSRFGAIRVSTHKILSDRGIRDDRDALQKGGDSLDQQTDGKWVADSAVEFAGNVQKDGILLIDSARIKKQIDHLRHAFGIKVIHVHLWRWASSA
jgi:adenylosuccinate synthase